MRFISIAEAAKRLQTDVRGVALLVRRAKLQQHRRWYGVACFSLHEVIQLNARLNRVREERKLPVLTVQTPSNLDFTHLADLDFTK